MCVYINLFVLVILGVCPTRFPLVLWRSSGKIGLVFFYLVALKDVLPSQHFQCWQIYVKACFLLCRREISEALVMKANELLNEFCLKCVTLHGRHNEHAFTWAFG